MAVQEDEVDPVLAQKQNVTTQSQEVEYASKKIFRPSGTDRRGVFFLTKNPILKNGKHFQLGQNDQTGKEHF